MAWFAFFLCFFGWFGIAPLMAVVREDLGLTREQIGNTIIASVFATIVARPVFGWLCDRIGPRRTYSWLLIGGSLPVMTIGLADSYEALLGFRLAIGVIGASFVITQYHTSVMFTPNCVGTANATSDNVAAMYFADEFELGLKTAGLAAASFGLMNLFARTLGGFFSDRLGIRLGLQGRVAFLGVVLLGEGIALMVFSQMSSLALAIVTLIVFSLFVQMAEGATFSLVPMINRRAMGSIAGIVGAGGNAGAVAAGFLFRSESVSTSAALFYLGAVVMMTSFATLLIRFSEEHKSQAKKEMRASLTRLEAETVASQ